MLPNLAGFYAMNLLSVDENTVDWVEKSNFVARIFVPIAAKCENYDLFNKDYFQETNGKFCASQQKFPPSEKEWERMKERTLTNSRNKFRGRTYKVNYDDTDSDTSWY